MTIIELIIYSFMIYGCAASYNKRVAYTTACSMSLHVHGLFLSCAQLPISTPKNRQPNPCYSRRVLYDIDSLPPCQKPRQPALQNH